MLYDARGTVGCAGGDHARAQRRYVRWRRDARRTFGSTSLKANGKIFAMLVKDHLVVKLPRKRVEELVEAGVGDRFDPGHGRIQKEWLAVHSQDAGDWLALATDAETFVSDRG